MQTNTSRAVFKAARASLFLSIFAFGALLLPSISHAESIIATTTVANVSTVNDQSALTATITANATAGVNDQTITAATTTPNVAQVSASRTMSIASLPANGTFLQVGTGCTINFSNATSTDSLNCAGGYATLSLTTHNTPTLLAAAMVSLTNVSDATHGALMLATTSVTSVSFTTAGTETSTTAISEADSTSGAITSVASTPGVVPVSEVLTLTLGGTVETGDTYTVSYPAVFTASYAVQPSDVASSTVANGIVNAIHALAGYNSLGFTAATSSGYVVLTAKTAGTPFYEVASTTNRAAAAQVNTITISGTVEQGDVYSITIPTKGSVSYISQVTDTWARIANSLATALEATTSYSSFAFTAATSTNIITLTAKTPSTGFTEISNAVNASAVAQVATFIIPSFSGLADGSITINGTNYAYNSATSVAALASGLTTALAANTAVSCVLNSSTITCTSTVPGTPFTYSTSFSTYTPSYVGVSGGSSGGRSYSSTTVVKNIPSTTKSSQSASAASSSHVSASSAVSGASLISGILKYKSRNTSVKILQTLLKNDGSLKYTAGVTGYYGRATQAAVEAFQLTHGVARSGQAGFGVVDAKTKAALIQAYGG